ncbi:penicillin acylase family protein [Sandarakinorhabdus sp.]|uniref:penicillin acylase family protein n=1 Tax=Sandarakinorhabdus sp. TaxID=1916663 RepID=UPI00286D7366|nr:penicillin acylase family protein [Sandarakinorhabdus sp.]
MPSWVKISAASALVLAALFVGLASWDNLTATAPAPDPVRRHDVRIVRDTWGVPHIYGKTDADVGYGIALAHAQDDFRNLEETLAAVRGRAGALLGEEGARIDFAGALLDARAVADRRYTTLSMPTRRLVEAYAQGLNDYAASHPGEVRLRGLFPVTGHDVVAGFAMRSPFFFGLDRPLGALIEGKLPPRDAGPADERGSNAFAVSARRSDDGTTRLIVNSHQPWEGPVTWWELVVHSDEGWDFAGALFPGAPFPLLGHNRNLGWANTVNRPDLIDTYKLVMDDSGTKYRFDGKWLPLQSQRIWLRVKVGPLVLPVPRTVYRSAHGPVIVNDQGAFAIRYAGIGDVRQVEQYYRLNKAQDFGQWRAAMAMQAIPGTNFVYADAKGHIGMFYNALFPARATGFDWKGVLPGDTSKTLWTRYLPWGADPMVVDPASGWVANSNNHPFVATAPADNLKRADFAPELGIETFETNRMHRFAALFAGINGPISRDALLRIKFDKGYERTGTAKAWLDKVLAVDTRKTQGMAAAQRLIRAWDWTLDGDGPADSLVVALFGTVGRQSYRGEPLPPAEPKLREVTDLLMNNFGRLDVPLGDFQRLRRGTIDLPVIGGPDALRAVYGDIAADGRRVGNNGDGFVMLVEWPAVGSVRSETIHQFGAATTRTGSPHYADQSPLFVSQRFKAVDFDFGLSQAVPKP